MSMAEVEAFINESFENWDVDNEESVKNVIASFQKFADSLVPPTTVNSNVVSQLFALFPPNETMILRSTEKLFKDLFSNAVIAVSKLCLCKSVEIRDSLMKHLSFIGNLFFLHDFIKPEKKMTAELFQILEECHYKILNVYSYCALINFVGVGRFIDLIVKDENGIVVGFNLSFLQYSLLPLLRKTNYPPSLLLADDMAIILKNSYNPYGMVTVAPPSALQSMTKEEAEAEMKEDADRIKKKLGKKSKEAVRWHYSVNGSRFAGGIVGGIILGVVGMIVFLILGSAIDNDFNDMDACKWMALGFIIPFAASVLFGSWLEWGLESFQRLKRRENAIYAEQSYYGVEGWEVRERGREAHKRKLVEQGKKIE